MDPRFLTSAGLVIVVGGNFGVFLGDFLPAAHL